MPPSQSCSQTGFGRPAQPGPAWVSKNPARLGPAQPRVQRMRCTKYAVVSQCVCVINEEHKQQKTTVVLQAFVRSVLQHTREGLKKYVFFV